MHRLGIVCAGGEQLPGEHEGSKPRQTHQQHDRGLPETREFDEYKDALPALTHGEVSGKPWGDERRVGRKVPSGHELNGGEVEGKEGRSHGGGLLLVAEERQPSSCSPTDIEETPIYAVNSELLCHVTLIYKYKIIKVILIWMR